jgi:hypothetical protein
MSPQLQQILTDIDRLSATERIEVRSHTIELMKQLVCGFTYGRLSPTAPLNHRGLSEVVGVALPLAITRLMGIFFIGNHLNRKF